MEALKEIIYILASHDPNIDWDSMPSRIELACSNIADSTNHIKYIRGALLSFVEIRGMESREGFLLDLAQSELLKFSWL